jgi:hypothetical protein
MQAKGKACEEAAKRYHGEFARLNFSQGGAVPMTIKLKGNSDEY